MFKKNKKQPPTSRRTADRNPQNASVFSYYNNRSASTNNVGRFKNEVRKGLKWQLIPSFIAVGVILVSLVYASTLTTNPVIRRPKTTQANLLQADSVYTQAAHDLLTKSPFNRSKLLINTKSIEGKLLAAYPELRSVSITVPLASRQPIVSIQPAQPSLILRTTNGAYILDDTGKALRKITDEAAAKKLAIPEVQDQTGLRIDIGKIALAQGDITFITEVSHQMQAKQAVIESLTLPALANELHLKQQGQPYYVKFNMLGDARVQIGTMFAIQEKGVKPAEYLDVRVDEKAFAK